MFPHKQFDSRQLSFGQNFNNTNNSRLGISPNMPNQNITQSANMENGSSYRSYRINSSMNKPTRKVSENRTVFDPEALFRRTWSGAVIYGPFEPPNLETASAPGTVGCSTRRTYQMNATPVSKKQIFRQEMSVPVYVPILTGNTQMTSTPNHTNIQRQLPYMKTFEASDWRKWTSGLSSEFFAKSHGADSMTKTTTRATPRTYNNNIIITPRTHVVTQEKKKPIGQDQKFHMVGTVEQVIYWNQMAKGRNCSITYELHGFLESVTEECPNVSILWIKQDQQNGPVIQGVFCNIDRRLSDKLQPGVHVVCFGRMIKTKIMQVFNADIDNTLEAGIKRISFLCQRSLQDFIMGPRPRN